MVNFGGILFINGKFMLFQYDHCNNLLYDICYSNLDVISYINLFFLNYYFCLQSFYLILWKNLYKHTLIKIYIIYNF